MGRASGDFPRPISALSGAGMSRMPAAEVKVPSIPSPLQHSLLTFRPWASLLFYKLRSLHQHCFLHLFPMSAPLAGSDGSALPQRKAAMCLRGSAVWAGAAFGSAALPSSQFRYGDVKLHRGFPASNFSIFWAGSINNPGRCRESAQHPQPAPKVLFKFSIA